MKKNNFSLLVLFFFLNHTYAQTIKVPPYLQDATPNSIYILWETDTEIESIVEWGLSDALGNITEGTAENSVGTAQIHTVKLEDLDRFTKYFYRVKTGDAISAIFSFKTPPFASDETSFRMIAMSDMQRDNSFPNKFQEVVEDGVIDYLTQEIGGDLIDNLALVLIPGDLVVNGNNYVSWETTFFTPAQSLFSQVPVYPVPGNHENNADYYFQYFKLPENGTVGFEEHWWHKDYGNVRIIGLDSNNPFNNQEQLDWLDNALDLTCDADSIDFVFAQLHHPHKSELWTPGESNYTGEVISRLENFSTECGKPSVHFFGHTHGYSRGQSRDHKHVWINAATAGGAIDNWGEFPNFDYDEFSVSQDDYGFVSVEVTDGLDPKVVVKRISRGDQDNVIDNVLTDSLVFKLNPETIPTPTPIHPINEVIAPECVTLKASGYVELTAAQHGQSHWQVSENQNDFSTPTAESWKNYENWYFEEDTQAGDDLTDETIDNLSENTDYWWRVRYRDRELNWSEWSEATPFSTTESIALPNLLSNSGSENNLAEWTIVEGVVESVTDGECDGIMPRSGERYFAVGGLCEHSDLGRLVQDVDVSFYLDSISTGEFAVNFGGYLSNFGGSDLPEMRLLFLDENNTEIGESATLSTLNPTWTLLTETMNTPPETHSIQVELKGTRNAGTDNDSYFDDIFLTLGTNEIECTMMSSTTRPIVFPTLKVNPNPVMSTAEIILPTRNETQVKFFLTDATGMKINSKAEYKEGKIHFEKGNLAPGTYFFWMRGKEGIIGTGKISIL